VIAVMTMLSWISSSNTLSISVLQAQRDNQPLAQDASVRPVGYHQSAPELFAKVGDGMKG
jgi:hypothetical protein